jgi:hypothetical protein
MKNIKILAVGLLWTISAYGQKGEFEVYPNGLIYSEQTMGKLSHIVDSLNLKYRTCNFNTVFYSKYQTIGVLLTMESGNINQAKRDIKNSISYADFIKKYPSAKVEENVLFVKSKYENYDNKEVVMFREIDLKGDRGQTIEETDITLYTKNLANKWVFEYYEGSNYSKESLTAFYFPSDFSSIPIPQQYAKMIGYTDCLIDTTSEKLKDEATRGRIELPDNWTSLSFEEKLELLDKLRSTEVVGYCSMDGSPRRHAVNIALLSAETYKWEIFLKSHLDIMNDNFSRMSDGSYAYEGRKTYIKELEELNINVSDLILGISFRVVNPAKNHYHGSISRVGRALSETKNRAEIENALLTIMSDKNLDYHNRILFYFLFVNYNHFLTDESVKKANRDKLKIASSSFPENFSSRLWLPEE